MAAEKEPIVKPMGVPIPSFFFSGSERRQREACAQRLPECRPSVRLRMEQEMEYSLIFPWAATGIALLAVLLWLRAQEKKKLALRRKAQRHSDSSAFRKLDKTKEEREEDERKRREREELRADF
jgi:hypothetical protein